MQDITSLTHTRICHRISENSLRADKEFSM